MAQLKDLLVAGASRFIGDAYANQLQLTSLHAPTAAGGTTYSAGTSGQYLRTNGTSLYWDSPSTDDIASGILGTARGGTGNNTWTASRLVYSNTATKLASTSITSDGGYLGAVSYLTINEAHQTSYRLKVNGTTGLAAGHLYLTGSQASSSTGNTTQIVFGTSATQHIALSSNAGAFIINPTTGSTTGQIVLKPGSASYISTGQLAINTSAQASYNLYVNGTSYHKGLDTHEGNIVPSATNTYDLGTTSLHWKTLYLNTQSSTRNNGIQFYNSSTKIGNIGCDTVGIGIYGTSKIYIRPNLTATDQGFTVESTVITPAKTNTIALGDSTYRWKSLLIGTADTYGSETQPIWWNDGVPQATSYNLQADVRYQVHNTTTSGWKDMLGRQSNPTLSVTRHSSAIPTWIPESYSSSLVWGGADTKGLLSMAYSKPLITFGGASTNNSTDDAPKWWFKLSGTSGTTYDLNLGINHYGICSTAAGTAAKTVDIAGFTLATGIIVYVKFSTTNTATNPTLNINNTGEKPIYTQQGTRISAVGDYGDELITGRIYTLLYDGTNYVILNNPKLLQGYEPRGTTTTLNKAANYGGPSAMFHLLASSSTSTTDNGKTPKDANVLQMNWDNTGGYDSQFAIATNGQRAWFRTQASTKTAWQEIAHAAASTQIGSETQPVYLSDTGVINASTANIGNISKPLYLSSGEFTATSGWATEYIVGTQTAATNAWTGVTQDTALETGKIIAYKLPVAGNSSAATLNLTLAGGTTTGAIPVKRKGTGNTTTHYSAGEVIFMAYDGTNWQVNADYDSNSNDTSLTYMRVNHGQVAPTTALYRYQLMLSHPTDTSKVIPMNITSNNTGTAKTNLTTEAFNPFEYIYWYSTTGTVNANTNINVAYVWYGYSLVDIRYSFNTGSTLTANKDVYLVAQMQSDGSAKLRNPGATDTNASAQATGAEAGPITQTLPTTEDGFIYIKLGHAYDTYRISLMINHPIYIYKDGAIRTYTGHSHSTEKFASAQSIALTGDVTGSASSQAGWSIATTIGNGAVTNAKLENSAITIAGTSVSLGGSISANDLKTALSLTGSYKTTQTAVTDPTANGNAIAFIDTISQTANGNISVTKKNVRTASTSQTGVVQLTDTYSSTDGTKAMTGKAVLAALQTLDVTAVGVAAATGNRYISQISETDGKISAILATATLGSSTKGVWIDAGTIKATNYAVSSTVNSGTANRIAYYSGTNAIEDAANLWTDGTYLAVNGTTRAITPSGYTSTQNVSLAVTGSIFTTNNLMTNNAVAIYKEGTGNAIIMRGAGDYIYGKMSIEALGTTSAVGNGRITLGNNTAEGTAGNARGQIVLYGSSDYFINIRPDALTDNILLGATATHFTMPKLWITGETDIAGGAANEAPFMVGPQTGGHLEFDGNEIIAKSNGTTYSTLYLQDNSSAITKITGELQVTAKIKGSNEIWGTNFLMSANHSLYNTYNDTNYAIVRSHNNGNITLNANTGYLGIGYASTSYVYLYQALRLTSGSNYGTSTPTAVATGHIFFQW